MRLILSADLSLNSSGLVIIDREKGTPIHYESITSDRDDLDRLLYNYNRFENIFKTYRDIECISYEAQNKRMRFSYNAGSILSLAENVGCWKLSIVKNLPFLNNPPLILSIPAQDIKMHATGNGNATKEDMIAAVNGHHIKSIRRDIPEHSVNDIADAYHLAMLTRELINGDKDYSKYVVADFRVKEIVS